ncbi:MAG: class I SAM-dependent methyltransferase [Pseudomonadota bacterium]|nr:class I SAM-dependent methyltransferase [Pseudomonadota bacterium]
MPSVPAQLPQSTDQRGTSCRIRLAVTHGFPDYQLLDSGRGRKLERYGAMVVDRPEPQAMWSPRLSQDEWGLADGVFAGEEDAESGRWRFRGSPPESWPMRIKGVTVLCRFSAFRHLGVFPEQLPHWEWMLEALGLCGSRGRPRLLNLFAYTGVASLLAAAAGAEVTHVDASKKAIEWAKQNQTRSGLQDAPIRWILDDARKFAQREVRRGRTYHGILIDPPKFGRGPNGEVWDLFTDLPDLLRSCEPLLDRSCSFLILTVYAIRASFLSVDLLAREVLAARGGSFESGELAIREAEGERALSASLFTRWASDGLRL